VLYLSFYFPPSRASGVFRARATVNHLAEAGWDVTVHSAPREFFEHYLDGAADPTLEATVDPRVLVKRPPMSMYHFEQDVRRFSFVRRNFPNVAHDFYMASQRRVFQEPYLGWIPGVLRAALAQHVRRPFDLVVATGNPFVSFAAARLLGRIMRVPYVVDYRDAWTFNQFTEEDRFPAGSRMMQWESKVLRDAAEIVFVNDGMRQWHRDRYPFAADRMTVVPNGWEPEILGTAEYHAPDPDRPLRFSYLGTVTHYMPLEVLFAGWRLARTHPVMAGAELNIYGHLGFFPDDAAPLRDRIQPEAGVGVVYRGAFSKTDAPAAYRDSDVLLFCVPGAKYVTSGKVFEYMATGKPIVSVHEPGIAAADVLTGYPLWFSERRLDADAVAQSFIAAAEAARKMDRPTFESAVAHAAGYTREATLAPWEQRLRALVKES
jgi:glycosyltransferase involved in cell wall biosynthesis